MEHGTAMGGRKRVTRNKKSSRHDLEHLLEELSHELVH